MSQHHPTTSDRKNLIRLASELPKGSEERKAILAGLRLASVLPQGDPNLGYISRSDGYYGTSLTATLVGGKVRLVVKDWAQKGGMDSMYGAGPSEVVFDETIKAEPREVVRAIKRLMNHRKSLWLNNAKPSEFQWHLPWGAGTSRASLSERPKWRWTPGPWIERSGRPPT